MIKQKQMTDKDLDQVAGGILGQANGLNMPKQGGRRKRNNIQESCANGSFFRSKVSPIGKSLSATDNDHKDW